jgi:hypothetical protein
VLGRIGRPDHHRDASSVVDLTLRVVFHIDQHFDLFELDHHNPT